MNRSRLLMIGGLALAIGLLVSYSVYNRLRTATTLSTAANGVPVLVAAGDIEVGAKLKASDVSVINVPAPSRPPVSSCRKVSTPAPARQPRQSPRQRKSPS